MIRRTKKEWLIVTFHTTAEAFQMEKQAKDNGFTGRIIPVPREISAGCGLAWRDMPELKDQIQAFLKNKNIEYEDITIIKI